MNSSFAKFNEVRRACPPEEISGRRARPLLGTLVEISVGGAREKILHAAIEKAFERIKLVHDLMSFHDESSDVSRLNRFAHRRWVSIHPLTFKVLKMAQQISEETNGIFDCAIANHLVRWQYLPRWNFVPRSGKGTFRDIDLSNSPKVKFQKPLAIDLGGIAKGFAVDEAVRMLKSSGVFYGVVNAGGDLKIFGKKKQAVAIRSPRNDGKFISLVPVSETSVATSAGYFSSKICRGRKVSAMVDPRKGIPLLKRWSVSVFADSCMIADALTKVVFALGEQSAAFMSKFKTSALILYPNNQMRFFDGRTG